MANPTKLSMVALRKLGRFLTGRRRLVFRLPYQHADRVECYSDTDWAECVRIRKSTSGGIIMVGSHVLKTWSSTQPSVSLSSGEAELYALTKAAVQSKNLFNPAFDFDTNLAGTIFSDNLAALAISQKSGPAGRT